MLESGEPIKREEVQSEAKEESMKEERKTKGRG